MSDEGWTPREDGSPEFSSGISNVHEVQVRKMPG